VTVNKKLILVFLAGWALAVVLPPQRVLGMFKGRSGA
jgi:hypothetical protein